MTLTMKREPEVRTGTTGSATTTGRKRRRASHQRQGWVAHVFLLPWMLGMIAVTAGPLIASAVLAFTDYDLLTAPSFIGFDNFTRMMGDERFWASARVTGLYVLVSVPLQLAFALFLAVILDKGIRGLSLYRSAFYLPSLLGGSVAIAILWRQLFGDAGLINTVLGFFGIVGPGWWSDPVWAMPSIILASAWKDLGFVMVILLAGLQAISPDLYDAAKVDGAGWWRRLTSVTLPLLSPSTFFVLIISLINGFQVFDQVYAMTGGGPNGASEVVVQRIYDLTFRYGAAGEASALSWMLFIVILAITLIQVRGQRRWVNYG